MLPKDAKTLSHPKPFLKAPSRIVREGKCSKPRFSATMKDRSDRGKLQATERRVLSELRGLAGIEADRSHTKKPSSRVKALNRFFPCRPEEAVEGLVSRLEPSGSVETHAEEPHEM